MAIRLIKITPFIVTADGTRKRQRPGLLPAFTLLGLAAVTSPPRHVQLEPRFLGLDRFGTVLVGVGGVLSARRTAPSMRAAISSSEYVSLSSGFMTAFRQEYHPQIGKIHSSELFGQDRRSR
jgi:hypothetical protein